MAYTSKRRNSEKRKEKSRDAARSRRGKESEIFSELAKQLPVTASTCAQLDKASVMRMVISMLRVNKIMEQRRKHVAGGIKAEKHMKGLEEMKIEENSVEQKLESLYSKALEGFFIIISKEGDIIYVTEAIAKCLGLQQIDLMGQSIYEFAHPCDHDEIEDMVSPHPHSPDHSMDKREFFIRLKCTLTSKGRVVNLKSATYKVIKFSGLYIHEDEEVAVPPAMEESAEEGEEEEERKVALTEIPFLSHLLAIGEPISHPSDIEIPLDCSTFSSRHNMNMKFTDCDDSIKKLVGYRHQELLGKSLYSYHHAQDSRVLEKAFKDLFSKGQTTTGQYRFLAKNGGYVWMVTQATIIYNSRTQKAQFVVCVHYVLSKVEEARTVLSEVQLSAPGEDKMEITLPQIHLSYDEQKLLSELDVPELQFSTEDVFTLRTDDMDTDFFQGGKKRAAKKANHVDLSQLAPEGGDVVIPLPFPPVESFGTGLNLYDDYADLEGHDHAHATKQAFRLPVMKEEPPVHGQKKSCYREVTQVSSLSNSPVMSPLGKAHSPPSYTGVGDVPELSGMDAFFSTLSTGPTVEAGSQEAEEIDFTMRAPYIPMSADDDLSLIPPTSEALFNLGGDFNPGLFGRTESVFGPKDKLFEEPPPTYQPSVQDMLGESPTVASIKRPQDTMILQMKRPLDKNSLEKGPPPKMARLKTPTAERNDGSSSVLKNLLMTGEDRNYGYKVQKHDISQSVGQKKGILQSLLENITQKNCQMNRPNNTHKLLQGIDPGSAMSRGPAIQ